MFSLEETVVSSDNHTEMRFRMQIYGPSLRFYAGHGLLDMPAALKLQFYAKFDTTTQ